MNTTIEVKLFKQYGSKETSKAWKKFSNSLCALNKNQKYSEEYYVIETVVKKWIKLQKKDEKKYGK